MAGIIGYWQCTSSVPRLVGAMVGLIGWGFVFVGAFLFEGLRVLSGAINMKRGCWL